MGNNSNTGDGLGSSNIASEEELNFLLDQDERYNHQIDGNSKIGDNDISQEDSDLSHLYLAHMTKEYSPGDSFDEGSYNAIMESTIDSLEDNDYFKSLSEVQQDYVKDVISSQEYIDRAASALSSEGAVYYDYPEYDDSFDVIGDGSLTFITPTSENMNSQSINRALKRIVDSY